MTRAMIIKLMRILAGSVVVALAGVAWGGQTLSLFAPLTAARWGLYEREESVEPMYWIDGRGEAAWDALSLWVMVVAGALLIAGSDAWAYFGLVGGGTFIYFAGRGIATRMLLRSRQFRIGDPEQFGVVMGALAAWGVLGLAVIFGAAASLD